MAKPNYSFEKRQKELAKKKKKEEKLLQKAAAKSAAAAEPVEDGDNEATAEPDAETSDTPAV